MDVFKGTALVKNINDPTIGGAFAGRQTGNRRPGFYVLG
jgi:hypothetical protein